MSKAMNRRLGVLERCQRAPAGPCCFENEAAALAAGATGGYFVVPAVMEPAEWCAAARQQQADLIKGICDAAT